MVVPLNDFTQTYIGNVLRGIAVSLGCPGAKVSLDIDSKAVVLNSENRDLQIGKDFTRAIVESTVKGMLSPLDGVVWLEKVTITTRD